MELCYNLQTCMQSPLEKDVELCSKAGFSAIEINFDKARNYLKNHSMEQLENLIEKSGLKVATLNAIFETGFCDEHEWERISDEFRFACELGEACRSNKVIVLSNERNNVPPDVSENDIISDAADVLNRLADLGKNSGMHIGYEPVGTMSVGSIKTAWEVVKKVNRKEVIFVLKSKEENDENQSSCYTCKRRTIYNGRS